MEKERGKEREREKMGEREIEVMIPPYFGRYTSSHLFLEVITICTIT